MKHEILTDALPFWGMAEARATLLAQRENHVYKVDMRGEYYILRLHRAGLRRDTEILSELQMLSIASSQGINVPIPIKTKDGRMLLTIGGVQLDMQVYVPGVVFSEIPGLDRKSAFTELGCVAGTLHEAFDEWALPEGFDRPSWDQGGLVGEQPVWGRFWDNPYLTLDDKNLLEETRHQLSERLSNEQGRMDYGLIHADMVKENVLWSRDGIALIDFDDSGFGYRIFDIATILQKQLEEPDYQSVKEALLAGYGSQRELDFGNLDMFLLLRTLTYLGWIIARMAEFGADERCAYFKRRSLDRARCWLTGDKLS